MQGKILKSPSTGVIQYLALILGNDRDNEYTSLR